MRRLTTLLLAATAGAALAGSAQAAVNLVTNGSFEDETAFFGWQVSGAQHDGFPVALINYGAAAQYPIGAFGEAVPADDALSPSPDAAGDRAAYFVSDFSDETISQTVHLEAGDYTIGFDAYLPANGFANAVDAHFFGQVAGVTLADFAASTGQRTTWTHFEGVAHVNHAGDFMTSFRFNTNGFPAKDVVIDKVFIVAGGTGGTPIDGVPEPATWTMMILGFGGAGFVARRRRRAAAIA